ncbi:rhomboid family intramembrane serine protease [Marinobacter fonticola]|uniref:rhomboid family intramembrane serine protease n=1 Tax=Marinobacter fonticola TaxID=2603215 RepID=UPI0011E86C75|nr:rhomboid family intramembrane serine protease [Marinobacter fonticola]
MLIIPVERSVDWRRPPWITLGLMLACFLVFVFYQSNDSRLFQAALDRYLAADLDRLEAPVYETYLQRQINLQGEIERAGELNALRDAMSADERLWVAASLLADPGFYRYVEQNQGVLWASDERQYWQAHRIPIQQELIGQLSAFAAGLVPAELEVSDLMAYQFLHGGWGHLIGNLVILFMLGFTVERALGGGRFLIAYLLCGGASGLIWASFHWGEPVPLVGASGSIAGLMGMYVAIFGMQRIRFFYFLGVYFDYFKAPALALLPVWIAKEIYDYWFAGATGVAYLAHAGGLLAGAGMVWLLGKSWLQVQDSFFEPEDDAVDERFRSAYAQAMSRIGQLDFEQARLQFEALWERHPDRPVLLDHLYRLAKLRPDSEAYRTRTREVMQVAMAGHQTERMLEVWQEYQGKGQAHYPLSPEDHNRVFFASLRSGELKLAEKVFERLRACGNELLTLEACRLLAEEFEKREMGPKARHYRQLMDAPAGP